MQAVYCNSATVWAKDYPGFVHSITTTSDISPQTSTVIVDCSGCTGGVGVGWVSGVNAFSFATILHSSLAEIVLPFCFKYQLMKGCLSRPSSGRLSLLVSS